MEEEEGGGGEEEDDDDECDESKIREGVKINIEGLSEE